MAELDFGNNQLPALQAYSTRLRTLVAKLVPSLFVESEGGREALDEWNLTEWERRIINNIIDSHGKS